MARHGVAGLTPESLGLALELLGLDPESLELVLESLGLAPESLGST
jgi:hypothetical protein